MIDLHNWPLFGIVGTKNSGKTTLICQLTSELTERNYVVNVIKKGHHDFAIDQPNTDSWKFRQAGANGTAVISDDKCAIMIDKKAPIINIPYICKSFSYSDIIFVESYKNLPIPKIELRNEAETEPPLYVSNSHIIALAVDKPYNDNVPNIDLLDRSNIKEIADFILEYLNKKKHSSKHKQ